MEEPCMPFTLRMKCLEIRYHSGTELAQVLTENSVNLKYLGVYQNTKQNSNYFIHFSRILKLCTSLRPGAY